MSGSSLKFYLFLNVSGKLVDQFLPQMCMQDGGGKDRELSSVLFGTR